MAGAPVQGEHEGVPERPHETVLARRKNNVVVAVLHLHENGIADRDDPPVGVQDALGLAGGARGIEHEGGVHGVGIGGRDIAARLQYVRIGNGAGPGVRVRVVDDDQGVEGALRLEAPERFGNGIHGECRPRAAVLKDVFELGLLEHGGRERRYRAELQGGEDGGAGARVVAGVDEDEVALADAEVGQARRQAVDLALELLVRPASPRPQHGGVVAAPFLDVAIDHFECDVHPRRVDPVTVVDGPSQHDLLP